MVDKFIKVMNEHLDGDNFLTPKEIYVLSYLKYQMKGKDSLTFSMKMFTEFVKDNNTTIKYSKEKESKVTTLDDKRSLAPVLDSLVELGLLVSNKKFSEIKLNEFVTVSLLKRECDGVHFEGVSEKFIDEMFKEVGVYGFYIYVYLKKICRVESQMVYKSTRKMAEQLGVSDKTIVVYIKLLEELNLLTKKSSQKANRRRVARDEEPKANEYYIPSKCKTDDRYYVTYSKP